MYTYSDVVKLVHAQVLSQFMFDELTPATQLMVHAKIIAVIENLIPEAEVDEFKMDSHHSDLGIVIDLGENIEDKIYINSRVIIENDGISIQTRVS